MARQPYLLNAVLAQRPTAECVEWPGGRTGGGYAQVKHNGRAVMAHRRVYELLIAPVPAGMELDHLCRNPACVNPAHLEPVSSQENHRRRLEATRGYDPRATCPRGHTWTAENTYVHSPTGQRTCRTCNRAARQLTAVSS